MANGMLYTPKEIEKIVNPSTGTGEFLNEAAALLSNPPYSTQRRVNLKQSLLARWVIMLLSVFTLKDNKKRW